MKAKMILIIFLLSISGCDFEEITDDRESIISGIEIKPAYLPDLQALNLLFPLDKSLHNTGLDIDFNFSSSEVANAMLLILKAPPQKSGNTFSSLEGICVAGVGSFIPGHSWNHYYNVLGATANSSDFFQCDGSNKMEPLSNSSKVSNDNISLPQGTYYWLVLGYNEDFSLTHSSPLFEFEIQ